MVGKSALQNVPRLLGALLAVFGLAWMLAACEGSPCPVGLPAPPPVALFENNGTLYLSSPGSASALQASDGSVRWHLPNAYFLGAGNDLVFTFNTNSLQALRASDHSLLWQHPLVVPDLYTAALTVSNGVVSVIDGEAVLALRASDGSQLWAQDTHEPLTPLLAVGPALVVVVTQKGVVEALRLSDGTPLWQTNLGALAASALVADGNQVYIGAPTLMVSLRADSGARLWQKATQSGSVHLWAASLGVVYLSDATALQALSGPDGASLWQISFAPSSITKLLVNGQAVYFTAGTLLRAVQVSNGASLWQHTIQSLAGGVTHALVATETGVYVGLGGFVHHGSGCGTTSTASAVEAVRATDGSLLWTFQT